MVCSKAIQCSNVLEHNSRTQTSTLSWHKASPVARHTTLWHPATSGRIRITRGPSLSWSLEGWRSSLRAGSPGAPLEYWGVKEEKGSGRCWKCARPCSTVVLFECTLDLESARKRRKKSVGKNVLKITRQRTSSSSSSGSSEPSSASSESPDSDHQSSESSESSESSSSCRFTSSSPSVPSLPTLQSSKAQKVETIARATTM